MKKSDLIFLIIIVSIYASVLLGVVNPATVDGVSMYPIFQNGALVFYSPSNTNIHVDSVIIYRSDQGSPIIHRVIRINVVNGERFYVTQGIDRITNTISDNRAGFEPPYGAPQSSVLGTVDSAGSYEISIPYLGYLSMIFYGI